MSKIEVASQGTPVDIQINAMDSKLAEHAGRSISAHIDESNAFVNTDMISKTLREEGIFEMFELWQNFYGRRWL